MALEVRQKKWEKMFVKNYKPISKCPFIKLFFEKNQIFFWDTLLVEGGGLGGGGLKKIPDSENIAQI